MPGTLALVILLDQYPRVLWAASPRRFTHDQLARDLVGRAMERGVGTARAPSPLTPHSIWTS